MSEALDYIAEKYNVDVGGKQPIEISDMDRNDLPELFNGLEYKVGAEIGVERGKYSKVLLSGIPGLQLHLVDAWTAYGTYRPHVNQTELDEMIPTVENRLRSYNYVIHWGFSMDIVNNFDNNSLDFVYIDANHKIPWCLDDICAWSEKVRIGGIVSGHDYYKTPRKHGHCHVGWAVECYVQSYRQFPWFVVGGKAKTPGVKRDKMRSWFWVKA